MLIQADRDVWLPNRALYVTTGASDRVSVAAASTINNVAVGTIMMLFWAEQILKPASQYNLWGKSTVNNRLVGTILSGGSAGSVQCVYANSGGGSANANATAAYANLGMWWDVNKWLWLAFTWASGASAPLPHLYTGDLKQPMTEVRAYTTQTAGTGTHDDSGSALSIGSASGGGNEPGAYRLPFFGMWPRQLDLPELRHVQKTFDRTSSVCFLLLGDNATGTQWDLSTNGNNGTITGFLATDGPSRYYNYHVFRRSYLAMAAAVVTSHITRKPHLHMSDLGTHRGTLYR